MSFFENPAESWNKLKEDSNQFQNPTHYSSDFLYTGGLEEAIRDILRLYAMNQEVRASSPLLRLFVENRVTDLQQYFNQDTCIQTDENIQQWANRIFEKKKYVIVVDCIERFSESLSSRFARLMTPYFSSRSPEEVSNRITLFIGNSGFTPFGAHIDVPGLNVTHFHLGPGSKSLTLWEESQFKALTKSQEKHCYDYKKYLTQGEKYELQKGDVFFFPADKYYHVGEYHEFSIAAAVGIKEESSSSLYQKAMSIWDEDIVPLIDKTIPSQKIGSFQLSEQIPKSIQNISILEIIEEYKRKKESNAFMHNRPILKKLRPIFLINKKVELNPPFTILIDSEEGLKNQLYSRGRRLAFSVDNEARLILNQLNQGETISCHKEMSKRTLRLIAWLFNTGSVIFSDKKLQ